MIAPLPGYHEAMIQYPTRKVDADRLVRDKQKMVHLLSFPHSKRDPQVELQKLKP